MLPRQADVTAITGQRVKGRPTAWQTRNGPFNVEHLGVRSPSGDVLVFFWSPQHDWQVVNVSQITGRRVASDLTSWQTKNGRFIVEHLAGMSPEGDLLVFWWSPQHDWQAANVSQIAGRRIAGPVTSWQTPDGPNNVEHLAGRSPEGNLLVFFWSPQHDWQVVDVSAKTGIRIASEVASWVTPDGPQLVEHLAAHDAKGALHVFWWSPASDWHSIDVSALTGSTVAGPPTAWVTGRVEHLGVRSRAGALLIFWWTSATGWRVVDASAITGQDIAGGVASYQLADGDETVELLAGRSSGGALTLFWWKPSCDWQSMSLSDAVGRHDFAADPAAWNTPSRPDAIEHWAAQGRLGELLVVWGDAQPRRLTDRLSEPHPALPRTRHVRRKLLVILWDPHRPDHPAPSRAAVEDMLFGASNSVRGYFLENSNGYFTIENAGVLGWYDADKPADHYWGPKDTGDSDHDGWVDPHIEKWAEAIRKAAVDFDFAAFDSNVPQDLLQPDELGILIVIPQKLPGGYNRTALARDFPSPRPLVVDGMRFGTIAEGYTGEPINFGYFAHELAHLFLNGPDMNVGFLPPFSARTYALMDQGAYFGVHIDPFAKLKYGWLRPHLVLRSGVYTLADVETRHRVRILMDPARGASEYFIVENRWRGTSYDKGMVDMGGLAVWHIIEDRAIYAALPPPPGASLAEWRDVKADDWARRGIRMLRPQYRSDETKALWDGTNPETGYNLLSAGPIAGRTKLRWADGSPSGFAIRNISPRGATMQVRIEVPF
jgi:M6 family metalloprotease-like protein